METCEICGSVSGALELQATAEKLTEVAATLTRALEGLTERETALAMNAEASIGRIVATVEGRHESLLEQRLKAAEAELAELRARAEAGERRESTAGAAGRKTVPTAMANLLAKQGVTVESLEAGALDAALVSLSLEQRIAVKAQLMRSGLLT